MWLSDFDKLIGSDKEMDTMIKIKVQYISSCDKILQDTYTVCNIIHYYSILFILATSILLHLYP